jgi:hypothetical protein
MELDCPSGNVQYPSASTMLPAMRPALSSAPSQAASCGQQQVKSGSWC